MNFNFAIKDLLSHSGEFKGFLKISISATALGNLFLNIMDGLSVLIIPEKIPVLNLSIVSLFSRFNLFLLILCVILMIFIQITNNHSLLSARKHDISVMKAIGSYPKYLYSFYLSELLLITGISYVIGYLASLLVTTIVYGIFSIFIPNQIWSFNPFLSLIIGIIIIICSFIINGWELRKIGLQSFEETQTGWIKANLNAKITGPWKYLFSHLNRHFTLAIKNLKRKTFLFRQNILLISIVTTIVFTGIVGSFSVEYTSSTYIAQAQGNNIMVIGAQPILDAYEQGYETFNNNTLENLFNYSDYLEQDFNLSAHLQDFTDFFSTYSIQKVEARLFQVQTIYEEIGFEIVSMDPNASVEDQYRIYGDGNRTRKVPLQGIVYESTIQNWHTNGKSIDYSPFLLLGDTIAGEIFENALKQKLSLMSADNKRYTYPIETIVIDSFNNGNSIYFPLSTIQHDLNKSNYINAILIDFSSLPMSIDIEDFRNEVSEFITHNLGEGFGCIDLNAIFEENRDFIEQYFLISLILSIFIGIVVLYVIYEFQRTRLIEDKTDFRIIHVLGGKSIDIEKPIFYQQIFSVIFGSFLGLTISLYILLILIQDAVFPSIILPILVYLMINLGLFMIARIGAKTIVKKEILNYK